MRTTLTALIHGESGAGKSWFADTVPGPRLVLDAEGRAKYTPSGPKVYWDPKLGPPPTYDGTWQTCIVQVTDFDVLRLVYQYLRAGQHQFVSIVIDSVMEAQKRCIDALVGVNALDQQDWGTLLRNIEGLVRQYRDLTMLPDTAQTTQVVVFVCGSREVNGKFKPLLQGQVADTLPYYLDVVGYLYPQQVTTPEGGTDYQRFLQVAKEPNADAKDNTGILLPTIGGRIPIRDDKYAGFDIAGLHEILHNHGKPEAAVAATA